MSIDWTKLYQKYRGQWVTLDKDEVTVISFGNTAKEAWDKAIKKGFDAPVLANIPEEINTYIGRHEV